jgi:protein involved in polysaccharide export with SLBB domain
MSSAMRWLIAGAAIALSARVLAAQAAGDGAQGSAHVRPGDRLVVKFLDEIFPADTLMVSASGAAVLPRLGSVNVASVAISDLADSLRVRYARYLRNPTVEVVVLRRVVVNGEVKKPDIYLVDARTTLRDAIAHAGGLTDNASAQSVAILRDGREIRVPNWSRATTDLPELYSGDQIIVGRKSWLAMNILPAVSTIAVIASILISLRR